MNYTPHTDQDIQKMLERSGSIRHRRCSIPSRKPLRLRSLDLPAGVSEMEALGLVQDLGRSTREQTPSLSFVGGGAYEHFYAKRRRCDDFAQRILHGIIRRIRPR